MQKQLAAPHRDPGLSRRKIAGEEPQERKIRSIGDICEADILSSPFAWAEGRTKSCEADRRDLVLYLALRSHKVSQNLLKHSQKLLKHSQNPLHKCRNPLKYNKSLLKSRQNLPQINQRKLSNPVNYENIAHFTNGAY